MSPRHSQNLRVFFSCFLFFAFLFCVVAGLHCPTPSSAAASHLPQPASHQSPSGHGGECPEQLNSPAEQFNELTSSALPATDFTGLVEFLSPRYAGFHITPISSYPLRFLLFSVFLN